MAPAPSALLADVRAEMDDLDDLVRSIADLDTATPAAGWSVRDTVSHLWGTDCEAVLAGTDPERFTRKLTEVVAPDPDGFLAGQVVEGRALGDALLPAWRAQRQRLLEVLAGLPEATRLPWYGPPMSVASFATARLMEYWAHGQDIADAAGTRRTPTARLRHIAHLGVRTRGFSYAVRGLEAPAGEVYVALTAPDGGLWEWGSPDAGDRVTGPAEHFCLLVTQRRHRDDLALVADGPLADGWLSVAQCFAGLPSGADPARLGLPVP